VTPAASFQPNWSRHLARPLCGLAVAREKGRLLTWDENEWLYVFDRAGNLQSQVHPAGRLTAACCSDDGTAYVACGARGEVWWLGPDLATVREHALPQRAVAAALDPFGRYLALADAAGRLIVLDRLARTVLQTQSPRPLVHLAFVPAAPALLAAADFGLVACLDLGGRWVWREGVVAHVGTLAVSGDGAAIVLACYSEGLQSYSLAGKRRPGPPAPEPCRLAAISFDGRATLLAGMSDRLLLQHASEGVACSYECGSPPVAVALGGLGDRAYAALADGTLVSLRIGV
jgi:hypothetical protein